MCAIASRPWGLRAGLFSIALLVVPPVPPGVAQSLPVMGYVAAKNANPKRLEVFKQGLAELGYVDGKNVRIEYRDAVLDAEYHGLMADLVSRQVNIILAANVASALAAGKATKIIPIVLLAVNDPVGVGLIKNLERPGTNITGTTIYAPQLIGERLRILQSIPNL